MVNYQTTRTGQRSITQRMRVSHRTPYIPPWQKEFTVYFYRLHTNVLKGRKIGGRWWIEVDELIRYAHSITRECAQPQLQDIL